MRLKKEMVKSGLGHLRRIGFSDLMVRIAELSRMRGEKRECNLLRKEISPLRNGDKVIIMMINSVYWGA